MFNIITLKNRVFLVRYLLLNVIFWATRRSHPKETMVVCAIVPSAEYGINGVISLHLLFCATIGSLIWEELWEALWEEFNSLN